MTPGTFRSQAVFLLVLLLGSRWHGVVCFMQHVDPLRHYVVTNRIDQSVRSISLQMGGYYSEPDSRESQILQTQQQHMIFGVPCVEEKILLDATTGRTIVNLLPIDEMAANFYNNNMEQQSTLSSSSSYCSMTQQLMEFIGRQNLELQHKHIVEIGCSGVAMVLALASGATSVTICHDQPERLRIWEHGFQFFQPSTTNSIWSTSSTQVETSKSI